MRAEDSTSGDKAAVRSLIDAVANAVRRKDIDGVMSAFSREVVSFDLGPPLQHSGGDAFVRRWRELFDSYRDAIDFEVHDVRIMTSGDLVFSYSLNRMRGTTKAGLTTDRWLRWTACYRKTSGKWLIVHEHVSVPVDLQTGQALMKGH